MSSTQLTRGSVRRALALSAAGAMVFALTPVQSAFAQAQEPAARDISEAGDPCVEHQDDTEAFTDINDENIDFAAECLNDLNIARGFGDGEYRPGVFVTREQMASFISRKLESAVPYNRPDSAPPADFEDREKIAQVHVDNVDILAELGIVLGFEDGEYKPGNPVTRAQMASFIVREMEEITGQELTATEDYFSDDDGNVHEDNINVLAEYGIAQGTGDGFDPHASVTRGQMALFIARNIDALENEFGIAFEPVVDEPAGTNQTFTADQTAATNTVSDSTAANANRGQRQYSVSGITTTTVDIALIPCDEVTVDADGNVTFGDDEGTANQADDLGNGQGALIEAVNGADVNDDDYINDVAAQNGTVTFAIDSTTANICVRPVVFDDADDDNVLDLDATDAPTEAFGVGGEKNYVPAEAGAGTPLGGTASTPTDEEIVAVDKEADSFATDFATYFYDSNDTFFIVTGEAALNVTSGDCGDLATQVTMAKFEAELSVNDQLDMETFYQPDPALSSRLCLEDLAPGDPTLAATGGQGEVEIDVTTPAGFDSDDTVTLQRATVDDGDDNTCGTADDVVGTYSDIATLTQADDENKNTTGVIDYTDAVAPGCYSYRSVATVDGEKSDNSNTVTAQSTADTTAPTMSSATPNDVNDGVGSTNQIIVTFSEVVDILDESKITVHPAGQPGLTFTVTASEPANTSGTQWRLTLSGTLQDASTDVTYQVDSAAGAYEDTSGNDNVAEDPDTTFTY